MKNIRHFLFKNKNYIAYLLVLCMLASVPFAAEKVLATSAHDKKNEAQQNKDKYDKEADSLKNKQDQIRDEISSMNEQLSDLLDVQSALEGEILLTTAELEQTQVDLEAAQFDIENQYDDMVARIQYMYENSTIDSIWMALTQADSFADLMKRFEYINAIHEADKNLTQQYQETMALVEQKKEQLLEKQEELFIKQEMYLAQQSEIKSMLAELKDTSADYTAKIREAEKKAAEYQKIIEEQDKIIKEQQAANGTGPNPNYPGGQNVSGAELVAYAMQFVGNPYVWGGNSLTKGCDCSGFVHLIYKHFGYKTVRYSMSFVNEGTPVSRENIRIGDIVVYERNSEGIGHVAIYAGDGKIIEAQSKKAGITCNRSVDYRRIVGIRRILTH